MLFSRPTTVDGAIKGLLKAISDLESVATRCNRRCSANRAEVDRLELKILADQSEMSRAEAIARKLKAITEE